MDTTDLFILYHENILGYLSTLLTDTRYSSVAFELITIIVSQLFRSGYVCSFDDKTCTWSISK